MAIGSVLDPKSTILVSGLSATIVYAIFAMDTPSYADVRYDEPGNTNTFRSTKTATLTSAAVVSGLALLSQEPMVFIVGGTMILIEAWKYHAANFGQHGAQEAPTIAG